MRIPIRCMQCSMEDLDAAQAAGTAGEPLPAGVYYSAQVREDNAYVGRCERGHTFASVLQNPRHEVLFASGALALLYGFHREAVASFMAALERFYEFATRVFFRHANVSPNDVDAWWKQLKDQSERQLGAFLTAYVLAVGTAWAPPVKLQKIADVRNRVIHKGHIPDRAEAMAFGDDVFRLVADVHAVIAEPMRTAFHQVAIQEMRKAHAAAEGHIQTEGLEPPAIPVGGGGAFLAFVLSDVRRPDAFEDRMRLLGTRMRMFVLAAEQPPPPS